MLLYTEMERVEGRLSPGQVRRLTRLRRDLNEARSRKGQRITNNSLIRVAVEGLLQHQDHLHGDDEAELLASWQQFLAAGAAATAATADPGRGSWARTAGAAWAAARRLFVRRR